MSERPEEPNQASAAESMLPIDEHVEEGHDAEGRKVRHRGIYLLPNLFTTANLFAGFYSIINSMSAQSALAADDAASASKYFGFAAIAIFVAMVLDGLDGRVARLTRTQSEFGAEYDSLSDMVSFGAAPALVMYEWALQGLGKLGMDVTQSTAEYDVFCLLNKGLEGASPPRPPPSPSNRTTCVRVPCAHLAVFCFVPSTCAGRLNILLFSSSVNN